MFDADPRNNPDAQLISEARADDPALDVVAGGTGGALGRGGMQTKLRAAPGAFRGAYGDCRWAHRACWIGSRPASCSARKGKYAKQNFNFYAEEQEELFIYLLRQIPILLPVMWTIPRWLML